MAQFTIRRGTHRTEDGEVKEAGDTVELSDRQQDLLNMDRFEASDGGSDDDDDDEEGDDEEGNATGEGTTEASGDLPDDYEMLQSMAIVYEGDEINGRSSSEEIEDELGDFSDTEIAALKDKAEDRLYDEPADAS